MTTPLFFCDDRGMKRKKHEVEIVNPSPSEMQESVMNSYVDAAREIGIDEEFLAKKGKKELNAKFVKHIKVSGRLEEDFDLPRGYRVIGVFRNADGEPETLLEFKGHDMQIRQRARESHNKLMGHQPEPSAIKNQFQTIIFQSMVPEPDPPPDEDDPNACISSAKHLIDEKT